MMYPAIERISTFKIALTNRNIYLLHHINMITFSCIATLKMKVYDEAYLYIYHSPLEN